MEIVSTFKNEFSRTFLLIFIPGAITISPFLRLLINQVEFIFKVTSQSYLTVEILIFSFVLFIGYMIQNIGSRIEQCLDKWFCRVKHIDYSSFDSQFQKYLFLQANEKLIVTSYYRSMLIRLKFELHSISSICIILIGKGIQD